MKPIVRLFVLLTILLAVGCRSPQSKRDKFFGNAERYLKEGRYSEATIEFRNALQIDGSHIPSYFGLAQIFKETGDDASAIAAYRKIVSLDAANIPARLEAGRYFLGAGGKNPDLFKEAETIALEIVTLQSSNIEAQILLANAHAGEGKLDKAINELETVASQNPANLQAAISLGEVRLQAKNPEEAERIFKSVLEKHPDSAEAFLAMATFLTGARRSGEAEPYLKKAFDLSPADPKSLYGLTSLYVSSKRVDEAENVFKEAIRRKPDEREPRWALANFYFQQGDNDKGVSALTDLLKVKPGDRQAQERLAESYLDSNNQTQAQALLQSVFKINPNDSVAHMLMGRMLRERNEGEKALVEFDTAIKFDASLIPPYIEKANLQMAGGNLDGAQQSLNTALQHDKNNLLVRGFLAKILALQNKSDDALREATAVLAASPDNEDAMVARGDALLRLGNGEESVKLFRKLTELRPQYPFYWHRLGLAEASRDDAVNAILHLRKAIEIKPDFTAAFNDLVLLQVKQKQYDAALTELEGPKTPMPADYVHRLRGQIYTAKGDIPTAEQEFRKAIELNPQSYANYMALGELSLGRRNLQQAMRDVDSLIAKNPKLPQAFFMKAYFLQLSDDYEGAAQNYKRALELDPESADVLNNLAWVLSDDRATLPEALDLAQKARRLHPTDTEMADTLGWVYYKMKNYNLAVDQFLFSVNNQPQPVADHYYHLGLAYYAQHNVSSGQTMMRKALQTNPSFVGAPDARRLLGGGQAGVTSESFTISKKTTQGTINSTK